MRLNLREIIHVPGASLPFQFQLDLSGEDFFGEHPIPRPVTVTGHVKNVADVLVLEGEARSVLDETCDRCMTRFSREKVVPLQFLLAETLENEEEDDIVLLDNGEVDIDEVLPVFQQALHDAGIDDIIAEKQAQLDAWLAAKA